MGLTVIDLEQKRKKRAEAQKRWYHKAKAEQRQSYKNFRSGNKKNSEDRTRLLHKCGKVQPRQGVRLRHLLALPFDALQKARERILRRTQSNGTCLLSGHACSTSGYPEVSVSGKHVLAAHVMLLGVCSPRSHLLDISHLCHNKKCVSPNHLTWETHSENTKRNFE